VLAVAVCAVLAGARSLAAIGEWAADAPPEVLVALGIRPQPLTGWVRAPDEATVRRVLAGIDGDALDAAIGAWLAALAAVEVCREQRVDPLLVRGTPGLPLVPREYA
jgi:DDE_Tnp_1-associated